MKKASPSSSNPVIKKLLAKAGIHPVRASVNAGTKDIPQIVRAWVVEGEAFLTLSAVAARYLVKTPTIPAIPESPELPELPQEELSSIGNSGTKG